MSVSIIGINTTYERQVETFLDHIGQDVEGVSRTFDAVIEIGGRYYRIRSEKMTKEDAESIVEKLSEKNKMRDLRR